jgi:predicted phage terminase large subunit-like protein
VQELRRRRPHLVIHAVVPRGDKVARAYAVTAMLEGGKVSALARLDAAGYASFRPWAQAVIDECAAFPLGAHDDITDSVTMALRFIRDSGVDLFVEDELGAPRSERPALFG